MDLSETDLALHHSSELVVNVFGLKIALIHKNCVSSSAGGLRTIIFTYKHVLNVYLRIKWLDLTFHIPGHSLHLVVEHLDLDSEG